MIRSVAWRVSWGLSLAVLVSLAGRPSAAAQRSAPRAAATRDASASEPTRSGPELSEADRAEARALFAAGTAAVDAGRWADAVQSYQRAYELTGAPSALFNLSFALRALGRYREAVRGFDALLALPSTSDAMREQASGLRDEVRARIALLRVDGLEASVAHTVRLDGEDVPDPGSRPWTLQADPGRHTLDIGREGYVTFGWTDVLAPGEMRDLTVVLTPVPPEAAPLPPPGPNLAEEPWLWVVVGAVLLGAGAAGAWYADDQAQLRPEAPPGMTVRL